MGSKLCESKAVNVFIYSSVEQRCKSFLTGFHNSSDAGVQNEKL
jgi:hypothetical protein